MTCKSANCECNDRRRAECDARLAASASKCRNQFCKQGDACPSRTCWVERSREEVEAGLVAVNKHITEAVQQHKAIDICYDSARRKIMRALGELPLPMTRAEQNRLLQIEQESKELMQTLFSCGVPPMPSNSAERTFPYLTRMFRGMNMQGCFRGRH